MIRKLSEAECLYAMEHGEFGAEVISRPAAAVILTQSWCPQWLTMKAYLKQMEAEAALSVTGIFYVEYDTESWEKIKNEAFMTFKENTFSNREIPYVRFYKDGTFSRDSNFISAAAFKSRLGMEA